MFILFAKRLRQLVGINQKGSDDFPPPSRQGNTSLKNDLRSESEFSNHQIHGKEPQSFSGGSGSSGGHRGTVREKKGTEDAMFQLSLKITVLTFAAMASLISLPIKAIAGWSPFLFGPLDLCVNGACIFLGFSFSKKVYERVCCGCSRLCLALYGLSSSGHTKEKENEKLKGEIDLADVEKGKVAE